MSKQNIRPDCSPDKRSPHTRVMDTYDINHVQEFYKITGDKRLKEYLDKRQAK